MFVLVLCGLHTTFADMRPVGCSRRPFRFVSSQKGTIRTHLSCRAEPVVVARTAEELEAAMEGREEGKGSSVAKCKRSGIDGFGACNHRTQECGMLQEQNNLY